MAYSRQYNYDQEGVFSYFVLSLLSIYLIPSTISRLIKLVKSFTSKPSQDKLGSRSGNLNEKNQKRIPYGHIIWVAAWILFLLFAYAASKVEIDETVAWDPYKILELEQDATPAEIKAAYKRLSLKWHPDKNKGNEEKANEIFVEIAKAHKTLTDEETMESWRLYGNPDNRKEFTVGIALPQWIVHRDNTVFVLGFYIVLLIIIVLIVGRWWTRSKNYLEDDILQKNANQFVFRLQLLHKSKTKKSSAASFTHEDILKELYIAPEFQDGVKIKENDQQFLEEMAKDKSKVFLSPQKNVFPHLAKTMYLINLHLKRNPPPAELQEDYQFVVRKCVRLLKRIIEIGIYLKSYSLCQKAIQLQQMFIQGVWDKDLMRAEFLQLPHITEKALSQLAKDKVYSIDKFFSLPEEKRKNYFNGLTPQQIDEVMETLDHIPKVDLISAKFYVANENDIHVGDILTFQVKFFVSYGKNRTPFQDKFETQGKTQVKKGQKNGKKTQEPEEEEEAAGNESDDETSGKKKILINEKELIPVHAPFFPENKYGCWWIILSFGKGNIVHCANVKEFTTVEKMETGITLRDKIQFRWPKAGNTSFQLTILSDSYIGCSVKKDVELHQLPPRAADDVIPPEEDEEEIKEEEPEEEEETESESESDSEDQKKKKNNRNTISDNTQ